MKEKNSDLIRTSAENPDFIWLNKLLDEELAIRDGAAHSFYAQYNTIDRIKYIILIYEDSKAVGCGAIKNFKPGIMEIKRMFVLPAYRRRGYSNRILDELENWTLELSYHKCILETGMKQPEAIALYKKCGYTEIDNYGQYAGIENSICFEKQLK